MLNQCWFTAELFVMMSNQCDVSLHCFPGNGQCLTNAGRFTMQVITLCWPIYQAALCSNTAKTLFTKLVLHNVCFSLQFMHYSLLGAPWLSSRSQRKSSNCAESRPTNMRLMVYRGGVVTFTMYKLAGDCSWPDGCPLWSSPSPLIPPPPPRTIAIVPPPSA